MFKRGRNLRINPTLRNMLQENRLNIKDFIYPIFITEGSNIKKEIQSMPGIFQISLDNVLKECEILESLGIHSILLFGIIEDSKKDSTGSNSYDKNSIIPTSIQKIKEKFPQMLVIADVCFCEYTNHGHCGILDSQLQTVDNDKTLDILAKQTLVLAQSGVDMLAPSLMMDGQVLRMKETLEKNNFSHIPIMSYSTKFASAYYGPFREAAKSSPNFGDRKGYQQDYANRREAISESLNDALEGADILMVKPALVYLDIVRDIRERSLLPLAVYNVSGEYSMLKIAQKHGIIDYEKIMIENLIAFKRAGADLIITYHAKEAASLIKTI